MVHGKVFLVGAGPGDPGLLTVRAAELLKKADVVVYDRLVSKGILGLIPDSTEKIYVGKQSGNHEFSQLKITELLIKKAREGKLVVRLKGGDPFLFGRGGEEAEALVENGIEFEVVPGVTSAIAVPAYAGIPLTHREFASSVVIVTGHKAESREREIAWEKIVNSVDTIVILMGVESLEVIVTKLVASGLKSETPIAIIEQGTLRQQRSIFGSIGTIVNEAKDVKPPAVIVIGEVVNLGRKLSWFERQYH
ncbi:MAG: uroporphyrinogen-III C-methyltransferase [Candidatus Bathyarchaeia archaeon]